MNSNDCSFGIGNVVDVMKTGATVTLRNAKIDMFKDTMRMAVDKWGLIQVTDPVSRAGPEYKLIKHVFQGPDKYDIL